MRMVAIEIYLSVNKAKCCGVDIGKQRFYYKKKTLYHYSLSSVFTYQIQQYHLLKQEGVQSHLSSQPISHELIKRSPEYMEGYHKWQNSKCQKDMLSYIVNNYKVWKNTPCEQCDAIDFLKMESFRGFVVHFMDLERDCAEVRHLFDYLKEQIRVLGYRSYVSDVKEFQRARWVEKVERHYLKPPLKASKNGKREQRFGNINIELLFRDGEPLHMKFSACTYQDHQFNEAEDFEELVLAMTK
jgi:hypothetical protein